jgi:uncharacterized 2Fe-2S/4Fe-4S cluster protein (DUF4445 family)
MRAAEDQSINPGRLKIRFANLDQEVEAFAGETLLQSARRAGLRMIGACGGRGVCASCVVRLVSGRVDFIQPTGAEAVSAEAGSDWVRACLVKPLTDCVLEVAPRALAPVVRTDVGGDEPAAGYAFAPLVRSHEVEVLLPEDADERADLELLDRALGAGVVQRSDLAALSRLSSLLRDNAGRLRAWVREGELIGLGPCGKRTLGLAVDLGTTNMAAYLTDLASGRLLANLGVENPQVAYGADLIGRLIHAVRHPEGRLELQQAGVNAIMTMAGDLCAAVGAGPDEIVDVAVCGNTAMQHLLLSLPVAQLARAPFVPATCAALDLKARDLGLALLPGAYVHLLPNIGGFVGGDHVATLLATEARWSDATSLVIDIGTNTEISLIHQGAIITASTASGPALEGGNISAGMRAAEGAIERVWLADGELFTQVIGGCPAVGICGSGVIDALASLARAGIIDRRGRICAAVPGVRENQGQREFRLAPLVALTQEDVRAVQLAKAAIRAGIDLLLAEAGLAAAELEKVVIAGAFGVYLDVSSAIAIGMFPELPLERFAQVGNAAGVGVRMALVSDAAREQARCLARRCRHLELGSRPDFQKIFLKRIGL